MDRLHTNKTHFHKRHIYNIGTLYTHCMNATLSASKVGCGLYGAHATF